MLEWLYEDGIGEERAILIDQGRIVEARISRHAGIKAGLVVQVRLVKQLIPGKRGIVQLASGEEMLLSPLPKGLTEGGSLIVEVTRAAIAEQTRSKLPLCRAAPDRSPAAAPTLREHIGEARLCHAHEADLFAEYGWHEVTEEARTGQVAFAGGSLIICVTPAMTVIDVDGELPPLALAIAAATSAGQAIQRLDLQGSIGIDFPGVADKSGRQEVAEALDAAMSGPFERTAVNGFGFLQLVKRRTGPSLPEMLQHDRITGHTLELLRMAERDRGTGALTLAAHPAVTAKLEAHPDWLKALAKRTGRAVSLRSDPKLAIGGYYAE
jgi:Ribonuclease G/E